MLSQALSPHSNSNVTLPQGGSGRAGCTVLGRVLFFAFTGIFFMEILGILRGCNEHSHGHLLYSSLRGGSGSWPNLASKFFSNCWEDVEGKSRLSVIHAVYGSLRF